MGMDVYGKTPTSEKGKYFRSNIWWWHPLADYVTLIAPKETATCKAWHTNEGDGLNAADAFALADKLQIEIDSGRCARYALTRGTSGNDSTDDSQAQKITSALDDLKYRIADQIGTNPSEVTILAETNWPFSVENVQTFVCFLRHCGGFEIC